MSVKITSDTTCDLSQELLEQYHIATVPLYIQKDQQTFRDGVDITPLDIIRHVDAGGALCSTAAPNLEDYVRLFQSVGGDGGDVIHFNIGSGFSSACQNARAAAQEFSNVTVVDSENLSTGQGLLVLLAARMAAEGADKAAILRAVEEKKGKAECSFLLGRLDYMRKGGRCSSVAALGANLLHIRPCIEVVDGALQVVKKYRGALDRCFSAYAQDRLLGRELDRSFMFITYTYETQPAVIEAVRQVAAGAGFGHVYETHANGTVTCHCGPGCLGVLFFRA